ncbi:MAG: D-alanyl-D-alanine carboxypeptidase [Variibacter sp.]|mgnify:CR=1 FL=1|nr:D-alanyl-D-alanine carboxypeptidase [Variibacter sp.]
MHRRFAPIAALVVGLVACAAGATAAQARPEALLLIEADSGKVLHAENATYPWYPASITKLMTAYVTLRAVKEGRIRLDTLLTVSENALAQQPSKMGFPVGTRVTVDNALKMMMVKSANDMAVVLAEGVAGSVEAFAEEMNRTSARLGMTQSSWVNPNGLPADMQVTSARDMAILARALIREFPEYDLYWRIPAIKFGRRVMRNYNKLIDRYPGADGMKTGFICASGYNLVASATRNGRRLIAVVLGAASGKERAETAAALLERGFNSGGLSWLTPSLGTVDALQPIAAEPPNLRDEICGGQRRARTDHAEEEETAAREGDATSAYASVLQATGPIDKASLLGPLTPSMPPIEVSVIPPAGAPSDPEALVAQGGKTKRSVALGKGEQGRKSAVINVSGDKNGESGKKSASSKAAATKPAPAAKPNSKGKPQTAAKPAPKGAKAASSR